MRRGARVVFVVIMCVSLGRTNNYIEEFFMGLPLNERTRSRMWTSLIPNTQVIVRPYPQAVSSE